MMFVMGMHDGTGNHPSLDISPFVCSSILSMQSGIVILYLTHRVWRHGQFDTVGVELNMVNTFFLHYLDDFRNVVAEHRLASCDLDRVACNRLFCLERLHHCPYLFHVWLIQVSTFKALLDIEEAIPARQVAPVCDNHVGKS